MKIAAHFNAHFPWKIRSPWLPLQRILGRGRVAHEAPHRTLTSTHQCTRGGSSKSAATSRTPCTVELVPGGSLDQCTPSKYAQYPHVPHVPQGCDQLRSGLRLPLIGKFYSFWKATERVLRNSWLFLGIKWCEQQTAQMFSYLAASIIWSLILYFLC